MCELRTSRGTCNYRQKLRCPLILIELSEYLLLFFVEILATTKSPELYQMIDPTITILHKHITHDIMYVVALELKVIGRAS